MSADGSEFYCKSKTYWEGIEPGINGMLGGYTNVNAGDADESRRLLKKLLKQNRPTADRPLRALDCGAGWFSPVFATDTNWSLLQPGIGRVTKYVLSRFFEEIDLLEQNAQFVESAKTYLGDKYSQVKHTYIQGIQEFDPLPDVKYDCIWGQWVFGYITDDDLVRFLEKCSQILSRPNGFVVIKDNVAREQDIVDPDDGSVTRSESSFFRVFDRVSKSSNLRVTSIVKQKRMPKMLLPVKMYVLSHTAQEPATTNATATD